MFRSTRDDIPFEEIGQVSEATYTDDDVLTTRPYLYKVVALNAGDSEASIDLPDGAWTPLFPTAVGEAESGGTTIDLSLIHI